MIAGCRGMVNDFATYQLMKIKEYTTQTQESIEELTSSVIGFMNCIILHLPEERIQELELLFLLEFRECTINNRPFQHLSIDLFMVFIPYLNDENIRLILAAFMIEKFVGEPHSRMFTLFNSDLSFPAMELLRQLIVYSSHKTFHDIFQTLYDNYSQYQVELLRIRGIDSSDPYSFIIDTNYNSLLALLTCCIDNKYIDKEDEPNIVAVFDLVRATILDPGPSDLDLQFFSAAAPYVGKEKNQLIFAYKLFKINN
jgi:hypothetical protein